jgi:hypothetical protein
MKLLSLSLFLFLIVPVINAAELKKFPLAVSHADEDLVGRRVAFALKEVIRGSKGFVLVHVDSPMPRITAVMGSKEVILKGYEPASSIAIALVYENKPFNSFLTLITAHAGEHNAEPLAKELLVLIDRAVDEFCERSPGLRKTLCP